MKEPSGWQPASRHLGREKPDCSRPEGATPVPSRFLRAGIRIALSCDDFGATFVAQTNGIPRTLGIQSLASLARGVK